jgi:hypothetical protein
MQLDITRFVRKHRDHMAMFSDSIANSGLQNISEITWRNAVEAANVAPLCEDLDALVEHFREYGAWSREELEGMLTAELNALLIQFIASDFQRYQEAKDEGRAAFREYQENEGVRLYGHRGRWYYYIGL